MTPPVLFGRRMRVRMRAHGVTVWCSRYGGIGVSVAYDPINRRPYHWQVDAWTKRGALAGDTVGLSAALLKLTRAVRAVVRELPPGALAR